MLSLTVPSRIFFHLVVASVFIEQIVVDRKILAYARILKVLADKLLIHGKAVFLIELYHFRKIVPAASRDKMLAVGGVFDLVKILLARGKDRS